jgi:uncharacterized protein (TIGR03067 family)
MRNVLLVLIAVGVPTWVIAAPKLKERPKTMGSLVGRWQVVEFIAGGKDLTTHFQGHEFEFTADGQFTLFRDGKPDGPSARYVADTTAKPATLDWGSSRRPASEYSLRAAFEVDGDRLVFVRMSASDNRPTTTDDRGPDVIAVTLTRKKD